MTTDTRTLFNATATQNLTVLLATALADSVVYDDADEAKELAEQIIEERIISDETEIEDLCDAYAGCNDGWHPERDWTEEYCNEVGIIDDNHTLYNFIDFEEVWERLLYYDFFTVKTGNCTYFFHNY